MGIHVRSLKKSRDYPPVKWFRQKIDKIYQLITEIIIDLIIEAEMKLYQTFDDNLFQLSSYFIYVVTNTIEVAL